MKENICVEGGPVVPQFNLLERIAFGTILRWRPLSVGLVVATGLQDIDAGVDCLKTMFEINQKLRKKDVDVGLVPPEEGSTSTIKEVASWGREQGIIKRR